MSPLFTDRRAKYREGTRREILQSAQEILAERGLEGFSMRRLAERCGCTPAALYHYFDDKERLIVELLEEHLAALNAELATVKQTGQVGADLKSLLAAFVRFYQLNPDHYRMLVTSGADEREVEGTALAQHLLLAPLMAFGDEQRFNDAERQRLEQVIWCFLHGLILMHAAQPDEEWAPDLLDYALDVLISGARTEAAPGRDAGGTR